MNDNAILIGMPRVGKSTASVITAKLAGYQFLDSDLLIMQQEGRLLRKTSDTLPICQVLLDGLS